MGFWGFDGTELFEETTVHQDESGEFKNGAWRQNQNVLMEAISFLESIETSDKADLVLTGLIQAMSYAITLPEVLKILRKKIYPRLFRILLESDMHD